MSATKASLNASHWIHPRYWVLWLFFGSLRLASYLPWSWQLKLGAGLGKLIYLVSGSRRRITRLNIQQAYPEYSEKQIKNLMRKSYQSLGISVFELALAWWAPRERLRKICTVEGIEHLEQALQKGNGAILLTGHFSTLEIGGILMALYTPLQAVYKKAHNPMFDHFMYHYRSKHLECVTANTNVREFIKGLRNGLATWYAPDQDFASQDIVFTPFLGGMASTLTSTARMAEIASAPVLPYYPQRINDGKSYKLVILPALENFPSGDRLADATRVNQAIENMVKHVPEQYAWIHKRFKTQTDGQASLYDRGI